MAKRKTTPATVESSAPPSEEYTVLARRYRPQVFEDLVGQEPVAQALVNALQSNRVAHAYLFTGARGVGKTSTARILAKALNCARGPTTTPCNQCELCQSISSGEDMDVLEIDGASNRGIDEVREIRQNVQYRPSRARYKIYIIDEVHMLTPPAFNALLKTLEEPPPHVKFIFATTEVQKIPVTILSRCQRFDFAGIGLPRIVERLKGIVASERMEADDEALELIARRAAGSMRDAQSLLDQLLAFGSERLTAEQVHRLLGTAQADRVAALATAVLEHDPKRALSLLAEGADQGLQLGEFLDQLVDYWRDLMVVHCAAVDGQALSVAGKLREALSQQAAALKLDTILAGLDILVTAKSRLRTTGHARILLEMTLVRLARLEDLVPLTQLAQWLSNETTPSSAPSGSRSAQGAAPAAGPAVEKKKLEPSGSVPVAATLPLAADTVQQVWEQVLAQVGPLLAGELRKVVSVAIFGPNTLVIRLPPGYNLNGQQYLDSARVARIEETLRKITGHSCSLRMESGNADGDPAAVSSTQIAEAPETSQSRSRRQRAEAVLQPLVSRAMELLGAQIVHMDDGFGAAPQEEREPDRAGEVAEGEENLSDV